MAEAETGAMPVRLRMSVQPRVPRLRALSWRTLPAIRLLPLPEDLSK